MMINIVFPRRGVKTGNSQNHVCFLNFGSSASEEGKVNSNEVCLLHVQ